MNKNNLLCNRCKAGIMCECDDKKQKKIIKKELVNHPDHYLKNSGHEVIDVIDAWNLDFSLGNAIKYIARSGRKNPEKEKEDLEKACWYIKRYIDKKLNKKV